jgi:hypothetical protein
MVDTRFSAAVGSRRDRGPNEKGVLMRLSRPRRFALLLSLSLLAVLSFALPASASAARVLYADGHPIDTNRLATFGGNTLTATFDGCSDSEWASALARTDFDVLIVGENAPDCFTTDLSGDTLTAIANYVRSGHPYIESGAHESEADFMNSVFGFSTANVSNTSGETLTGTLLPSAAGTLFAGGPATLTDPSATELLSGTPGNAIYSGPEGTWVFTVPFGSGTVTYLGWDLCGEPDDCGNTPSVEDDWYRVLDRAIQNAVNNAFTVDGITRNKKRGTATVTVTLPHPGELIASGNGVTASSTGRAVISKSVGVGQAQLFVKAQGKKKRKLKRKGKAKLSLAITYTPTGGSANTQSVKVKLKKKLKKK